MVPPTKDTFAKELGKARISKSGQVTIPVEIRRELGAEIGDTIVFGRNSIGNITILKPHTSMELSGRGRPPIGGVTVSELIEETDRTPIVRRMYAEKTHASDD